MSLTETVHRLVVERTPFHDQLQPIVASDEGITLRCDLNSAESVGCTLSQIDLVDASKSSLSMDELVHWAEFICGRVTYLLEPLQLIELDGRHGVALVRSRRPQRKKDQIAYYEFIADKNHHASLRRYRYDMANRDRGTVPFPLTHEQLEVLVDDLVESAKSIHGSHA